MAMKSSVLAAGVTLPLLGAVLMSGAYTGSGQFLPMSALQGVQSIGNGESVALLPAQARKSSRESSDSSSEPTDAIVPAVASSMGIAGRAARDRRHAKRLAVLDEKLGARQTEFSPDLDPPQYRNDRRTRRLGAS